MHASQLLTAVLFATTALSKPIWKQRRQDVSSMPQPSWVNDDTGNVTIVFSDTKMSFGDQNPSDVMGQLFDQCYDAGTCNPDPFTVTAWHPVGGGGLDTFDLSLNIQTSFYPTWVKNGLIEAMQGAAGSVSPADSVTYSPNTICTSGPDCVWQPDEQINQYTFPDGISIVYANPDPSQGPLGVITVGISLVEEDGDGFCSTFTTVGSAVAGAVNGVAGGIFSLIGLACTS